jgi:hypothetical protein
VGDTSVELVDSKEMNAWLTKVHYLHRPVIRSKLLAYAVCQDGRRIGGMLWATPPFTKKKKLIGQGQPYDKWETVILARMYLRPDADIKPSWALSQAIGTAGRKNRRHKGWRIQQDWVMAFPPRFPENPFVPRLLLSWSDTGLYTVDHCVKCGDRHIGNHQGVIYKASGWEFWDESYSTGTRSQQGPGDIERDDTLPKRCWILKLPENNHAYHLGIQLYEMKQEKVNT